MLDVFKTVNKSTISPLLLRPVCCCFDHQHYPLNPPFWLLRNYFDRRRPLAVAFRWTGALGTNVPRFSDRNRSEILRNFKFVMVNLLHNLQCIPYDNLHNEVIVWLEFGMDCFEFSVSICEQAIDKVSRLRSYIYDLMIYGKPIMHQSMVCPREKVSGNPLDLTFLVQFP